MPFAAFVAQLHAASPAGVAEELGRSAALDSTAFETARNYLIRYYAGMTVDRTVLEQDGRVLDCIRYEQQPSLHMQGLTSIAAPPPFAPPGARSGTLQPRQKIVCGAGSFPIQRVTLTRVMRAGSLRNFFRKEPASTGPTQPPGASQPDYRHTYSFAYDYTRSYGGQTNESLYSPPIRQNKGEIFSLEQQWYIGGAGSHGQTAETGWQSYPALYNTPKSVLFAYYTADGYNLTGCYNYDCAAFVQLPGSTVTLGAPFTSYSVAGGQQVGLTIGYTLYQGAWYLSFGDTWVGYYPISLYNGGQLSRFATLFEAGTETVGNVVWPQAASGRFAGRGYPLAGYQFDMLLFDAAGHVRTPTMTAVDPSPGCYTTTMPGPITDRGYGFFLGGPGGRSC